MIRLIDGTARGAIFLIQRQSLGKAALESASGVWKVSVIDNRANGSVGSLASAKIKVYGSAK